jgi:hypothetical protein
MRFVWLLIAVRWLRRSFGRYVFRRFSMRAVEPSRGVPLGRDALLVNPAFGQREVRADNPQWAELPAKVLRARLCRNGGTRARIFAAVTIVLLTACVHEREANKEANKQQWSEGVIVAMNMCAKDGSFQHTKDPEGHRAYCGQEVLVGTHLPKCVCRYEQQGAQQREESQQYLRDAAHSRELLRGN